MKTNILKAILNIVNTPPNVVQKNKSSSNRMNDRGVALEEYIKDSFASAYNKSESEKNDLYSSMFSYLGNQNNPPDMMIKDGDAIEVKKIESINNGIALNSSYPKNKIYSSSSLISKACRDCEAWNEKDIIYAIGTVDKETSKLKHLWFVYGKNYAADESCYLRIKNKIIEGVQTIPDVELASTNEIARVNKVDPLAITYLRVRGMWGIENPNKVFEYIYKFDETSKFSVVALIDDEKYMSFPKSDRDMIENNKNLKISNVKIKNPNNPADLLNAKLITFKI